jgi:hypothetical protein
MLDVVSAWTGQPWWRSDSPRANILTVSSFSTYINVSFTLKILPAASRVHADQNKLKIRQSVSVCSQVSFEKPPN